MSQICRGVESSRSCPRTTRVTPMRPSSTATASWYAYTPSDRRRIKSPQSSSSHSEQGPKLPSVKEISSWGTRMRQAGLLPAASSSRRAACVKCRQRPVLWCCRAQRGMRGIRPAPAAPAGCSSRDRAPPAPAVAQGLPHNNRPASSAGKPHLPAASPNPTKGPASGDPPPAARHIPGGSGGSKSSMRRSSSPPRARISSQQSRAANRLPRCILPLGVGAKRPEPGFLLASEKHAPSRSSLL